MNRTETCLMREEQRPQAQVLIDQMGFPSWLKTEELELGSAHIAYRDSHPEGFMSPQLVTDPLWPAAIELSSGCWGVTGSIDTALFQSLYASSFSAFAGKALLHRLYCPASKGLLGLWSPLGFTAVQAYGSLDPNKTSISVRERNCRIREATRDDSSLLKGFSTLLALHQAGAPIWAGAPSQYLEGLEEGFSGLPDQKDLKTFIIESGRGEPIGYSVWEPDEHSGVAYLAATAILEAHRGKGAGRALLGHALSWLVSDGFTEAVTDWRCANLQADTFWTQAGFQVKAYRLERRFLPGEFEVS